MLTKLIIIFLILSEQAGFIIGAQSGFSNLSLKYNIFKPAIQTESAEITESQNLNQYSNNQNKNFFYLKQKNIISENILPLPEKNPETSLLQIEAESGCVLDIGTGKILWEKEANIHKPIASITKIITALVVLDNCQLEDKVIISYNAISTEGDSMLLYTGEEVKVENLLYGLLISSSNDAAMALAEHTSGSIEKFAELMNKKAKNLGLNDTSFFNSAGFDAPSNYSTSYEVALLTKHALENPIFAKIVKTKDYQFTSQSGISHRLVNSNKLLGIDPKVVGVKTGFTDKAGECLVTSALQNSHQIITVVLNSPNRTYESQKLIDWTFSTYTW